MSIIEYFKGVGTEMKHVTWPTRRQTIIFTVVVVIISLVVAYFLGAFDLLFSKILNRIVE